MISGCLPRAVEAHLPLRRRSAVSRPVRHGATLHQEENQGQGELFSAIQCRVEFAKGIGSQIVVVILNKEAGAAAFIGVCEAVLKLLEGIGYASRPKRHGPGILEVRG